MTDEQETNHAVARSRSNAGLGVDILYSSCPTCGDESVALLFDDDKEIIPLECYNCLMKEVLYG